MPKLAALASADANICFASSSVRLAYVRGMSPHLNTGRIRTVNDILNGLELFRASLRRASVSAHSFTPLLASIGRALRRFRSRPFARSQTHEARNERVRDRTRCS